MHMPDHTFCIPAGTAIGGDTFNMPLSGDVLISCSLTDLSLISTRLGVSGEEFGYQAQLKKSLYDTERQLARSREIDKATSLLASVGRQAVRSKPSSYPPEITPQLQLEVGQQQSPSAPCTCSSPRQCLGDLPPAHKPDTSLLLAGTELGQVDREFLVRALAAQFVLFVLLAVLAVSCAAWL